MKVNVMGGEENEYGERRKNDSDGKVEIYIK